MRFKSNDFVITIGIPMIDLDLLRSFLAVYRCASVTKAAKLLALSQPTLTGRLQALEARIGKSLFVRDGRGIRATAEARSLAREIGPYLDGVEAALGAFDQSGDLAGPVRIAGPIEFIERLVLPILAPLVETGIRPEFRIGHSDERIALLISGEADLAILTSGGRSSAVTTSRWRRERFIFVASPRWVERLRGRVGPQIAEGEGAVPMLAYADTLPMIR